MYRGVMISNWWKHMHAETINIVQASQTPHALQQEIWSVYTKVACHYFELGLVGCHFIIIIYSVGIG